MLKIHPKYLTDQRLLALWREALNGQRRLLAGFGWADFSELGDPLQGIGAYLSFIASEGLGRGFKMNHELIFRPNFTEKLIPVSYSFLHDESLQLQLPEGKRLFCNPVYKIIN